MNIRTMAALWFISFLTVMAPVALQAQESSWPKSLSVDEGSITIYPLQVEAMDGDVVRYRAALAYRKATDSEPVFGAGWFASRVEIDRDRDLVHPIDLEVVDTRFPDGTEDVQPGLTAAVDRQSPGWDLDFSLTELLGALETAKQEAETVQNLNTAPPTIIYRDHPALLVTIDGEPVMRVIENSSYQAVINTPYPLIFDGRAYHLGAAKGVWYRADDATGPYRYDASPPADIVKMVDSGAEAGEDTDAASAEEITAANAPEIIVSTTPAELIVTEGPAAFVPLVDDLLVLSNTSEDVFMHISSQQFYVVLAGRWYQSDSLNGPWRYRAADDLPAAFADIPKNSQQAGSRVYVAGTEEAREAVLDAQVPQPAVVDRGTVDLDVNYDGDPDFEPVEGTENLAYARNSDSTVLQEHHEYYLVEDGVWYVSSSPDGPWVVSDYRPAEVPSISPRSPVYNVKYVYIYDSTPEVVYVGYTPGYVGSYIYGSTIVYGTGWYYRPWISPRYYYPRYSTWGFNVGYNPWWGWSFGLSWGWGPFYAGYYSGGFWHHNRPWYRPGCGYWGPAGYRPRPVHHGAYAYNRGRHDHHGYGSSAYGHQGYGRGGRDTGYGDPGRHGRYGNEHHDAGNAYVRNQNLYRDRGQRARVAEFGGSRSRGDQLQLNPVAGYGKPSAADRSPSKLYGEPFKGQQDFRNRTGPVKPTELRVKAQVRDARRGADLNQLMADNSGYARRRAQAPLESSAWQSVSGGEVRRARDKVENTNRNGVGQTPVRSYNYRRPSVRQGSNQPSTARQNRYVSTSSGRAGAQGAGAQASMQRQGSASREPLRSLSATRSDGQGYAYVRSAPPRDTAQIRETQSISRQRYASPVSSSPVTSTRPPVSQTINTQRRSISSAAPPRVTQQSYSTSRNARQKYNEGFSAPSQDSRKEASSSRSGNQRSSRSDGGRGGGGRSRRRG